MFQHATPLHAVWADDPAWTPPADGAPVDSWRNESGGTLDSAGDGRPTYIASWAPLNNRPTLWFDGVDDYIQADIADISLPFQGVFVVWPDSPVANRQVFGTGASNGGVSTNLWGFWTISNTNTLASTTPQDPIPTILHVRHQRNGNAWIRVNGVEVVRGNAGGATTAGWFKLGTGGTADAFNNRWWRGYISFAGLYADTTDVSTLIAALAAHYGAVLA